MPLPIIRDVRMVKQLAEGHPVFKVTNGDGSTLVVKGEKIRQNRDVQINLRMMKQASPELRDAELLTPQELDELKIYCARGIEICRLVGDRAIAGSVVAAENRLNERNARVLGGLHRLTAKVGSLLERLTSHLEVFRRCLECFSENNIQWVKLPFMSRVITLDPLLRTGLAPADEDVLNLVYTFFAALAQPQSLARIGRIVAVDLFNNNTDRFSFNGEGMRLDNNTRFRAFYNLGNIMLVMGPDASDISPSGLDYFDPNAQVKMDTMISGRQEWRRKDLGFKNERGIAVWSGYALENTRKAYQVRRDIARDIANDFSLIFSRCMITIGTRGTRVTAREGLRFDPEQAASSIHSGMEAQRVFICREVENMARRCTDTQSPFYKAILVRLGILSRTDAGGTAKPQHQVSIGLHHKPQNPPPPVGY